MLTIAYFSNIICDGKNKEDKSMDVLDIMNNLGWASIYEKINECNEINSKEEEQDDDEE